MAEEKVSKILLREDAGGRSVSIDAHERAVKTLCSQRRAVQVLAGLTVFFWVVAAGGVLVFYFGFIVFVWPRLSELWTHPNEPNSLALWQPVHRLMTDVGSPLVVTSVVAMVLAAICTVLLVFISRRVTLRQISLSLAEISRQLAELQKPS